MPSVGDLRHRIDVQTYSTTADTLGGQVPSWSDLITSLPAGGGPLSGRERFQAQSVNALTSYRWTIRYRADVRPKMRVVWGNSTQEITSVVDEGARRRWLILDCQEITT